MAASSSIRSGRFHSVVPRGSHVRSYHVVGVQMAHPSAFARLPLNEPAESIGALYKELVKENLGHVRAFLCAADFWDVGTPADYLDACLSIGRTEGDVLQVGRRSVVEPSAQVTDSVIWDDVTCGRRRDARTLHRRGRRQNSRWSQLPAIAPSFKETESSIVADIT